ncbi:MAG: hypothetical protein LW825_03435 [Candidatus Jidaibacter sp.]|nr:hypothetical protein [Candidatus Jidaibacter sp.]
MNRYLRFYFLPGVLMLAMAISFLFFVKNRVQQISRDIKTKNTQILSERESIHVLKAEHSYLTNPKRLKKLTEKNLNLHAPVSSQILDSDQIEIYLNPFVVKVEEPSEGGQID